LLRSTPGNRPPEQESQTCQNEEQNEKFLSGRADFPSAHGPGFAPAVSDEGSVGSLHGQACRLDVGTKGCMPLASPLASPFLRLLLEQAIDLGRASPKLFGLLDKTLVFFVNFVKFSGLA